MSLLHRCQYIALWGTEPAPQGSKTPWGTEANPRTGPWREALAAEASATRDREGWELIPAGVPIRMHVTFKFARPKAHFRTNGEIKESAPFYVTKKPDLDKLVRALGDALTGVIYHDDSQIASLDVTKVFCQTDEVPGVEIIVRRVG